MRFVAIVLAALACAGAWGELVTPFALERLGKVEAARWEVAYDFMARLNDAERVNDEGARVHTEKVQGVTREGIFHHPNLNKDLLGELRFKNIALPKLQPGEKLLLHFFTTMSSGVDLENTPGADGCTFIVRVDGLPVLEMARARQSWSEHIFDLTDRAGQTIEVDFVMDPRSNTVADWAFWGRPRILIEGRKAKMKEGPKVSMLSYAALDAAPLPDRVLEVSAEGDAATIVAVMDPELDLPAMVASTVDEAGPPPLAQPPALVVGEGADPGNHTVVRILDRYHVAAYQFLAYPPEVRGGVCVQAGALLGGATGIAACPLSDATVREVRVFDARGGLLHAFDPGAGLRPPYALAVGDFLNDHGGDEIAVASREDDGGDRVLLVLDAAGRELARQPMPGLRGRLQMAAGPVESADGRWNRVLRLSADPGARPGGPVAGVLWRQDRLDRFDGIYPSAFGGNWLTVRSEDESHVESLRKDGHEGPIDVGTREKKFWYQWYRTDAADFPEDGAHIHRSTYAHLRTDNRSRAWSEQGYASDDPEIWAGEYFKENARREMADYDTALPKAWEPCFTHRMGFGGFDDWAKQTEPESGFSKYTMLTRNNNVTKYGEFGVISFYASTYAFGLPALEKLYILPLRAYLRELAHPFRNNPEHLVGLEPNHEHEIAVGEEGTRGDYNLWNIAGYYQYLRAVYGDDRAAIARALGAPLAGEHFDAPRAWDRGDWDGYEDTNPFFREWVAYQRYVVNRRLAQTFREALLAGFPPEIIKSHQIPDTYAIGNLDAFSDIVSRYTPIDYAMNAGVGYGFTRYTTWYKNPLNCMQGSWSSGFDHVLLGEYQALTPSVEDAYGQLRYIFDHGGYSLHCMLWPQGHDQGYNDSMDAALRRLIAEDPPRPGTVGGVGQVVPVVRDGQRYNIVQVGAGPERTGLLKSVNADGSWEGSVYVQPFHAHVHIGEIPPAEGSGLAYGPLQGLDSGSQLELTFHAAPESPGGTVTIAVLRGGVPLPGLAATLTPREGGQPCRYLLRVQLPVEDITLRVTAEGASVDGARLVRHTEQSTKLPKGILTGQRHRGGVTFDTL